LREREGSRETRVVENQKAKKNSGEKCSGWCAKRKKSIRGKGKKARGRSYERRAKITRKETVNTSGSGTG